MTEKGLVLSQSAVVVGCQWGDEGKGKVIDWMTSGVGAVVRFQGGHNAGHTLLAKGTKIVLHVVPSGIFEANAKLAVGQGVVLSLPHLAEEVCSLQNLGIDTKRLILSPACPLVLPSHAALDGAREKKAQGKKIGTTGLGIGPAYEDKVARRALRLADLKDEALFCRKLEELLEYHNFILTRYHAVPGVDAKKVAEETLALKALLLPHLGDVGQAVTQCLAKGDRVLFEGAQGTFLDIDHGTYPYVTSSNTLAGAVCTGVGIGPFALGAVLGVSKAYTTRVGEGPFPTELTEATGEKLRQEGNEYGATTGRPRRCGWLDVALLRRAVALNGITSLCLTKLDVLDAFPEVKIATGYHTPDGPLSIAGECTDWNACQPRYEILPGWQENTSSATCFKDLPKKARAYVERIEELLEVPISVISTGPGRDEMIVIQDPWTTGAEKRTRTSTMLPSPEPESGASTNSATSAKGDSIV